MIDYNLQRNKFVRAIKSNLYGENLKFDETSGAEILIEPNPFNRYTIGILYPASLAESLEDNDEKEGVNPAKASQKYQPPSSMGFSFYVDANLAYIKISYEATRFLLAKAEETGLNIGNKVSWKKTTLTDKGIDDGQLNGISIEESSKHIIYNGKARIDIVVRSYKDGKIVTVTLSNTSKEDTEAAKSDNDYRKELQTRVERSLFEVGLSCHFDKSALRDYPRVSKELLTEEEKELELRYKDKNVYAIGHGVAVDWKDEGASANEIMIYSDFMPTYEVPQVTAKTGDANSQVLHFEFLNTLQTDNSVFIQLNDFVEGYRDWISTQEALKATEDDDEQSTAQNIIQRMEIAYKRMKSGIGVLQTNDNAQQAFALANKAMLMQMQKSRPNETTYTWRPFQLAFFLMVLESVVNEDDEFRDLVDLIWFPTGGGKTEAYLGVMAFLFGYRRLTYTSSGNGTIAIMRYTLRLLTSQQFVRACRVIGALELIRRTQSDSLGSEPFSVGLWLGGASSPNSFKEAMEYKEKQKSSKFILTACPWCADNFTSHNYYADENKFHFLCTNSQCDFGGQRDNQISSTLTSNTLPFNMVDEALYANPPWTFLVI